jgi:Trypsin-like peptidase domain
MRQDIRAAVRPVLFQTGWEEWPYSHGGSLFIVNFERRCYGLTCRHVIRDEGVNHLFVAPSHVPAIGMRPASIERVARIDDQESSLQDIAVICFSDEIGPEFFGGTAYVIGPGTVGTSDTAHRLKVYGFLSTKAVVDCEAKSITGGYCDLQFHDVGETSSDPFIRQAVASYAGHSFSSLDGISGAPVFDETEGRLCGMVARAGLNNLGNATLWYIDIFHIIKLVEAIHAGSSRLDYLKYPSQV